MKLGICIPTYNRIQYLKNNLDKLRAIIVQLDLKDDVMIFVSDNCSDDGTKEFMEDLLRNEQELIIKYNRNSSNLGAIKNFIFMINAVDSDYIMFLGDDDFISREYLKSVYDAVKEHVICIIPSYLNIDLDGKYTGRGRDAGKCRSLYEKGFRNCLENSWRGHQMSGIVFDRNILWKESQKTKDYNLYLIIYWVACMCMNGRTLHLPEYPVLVTRPPQKNKTWGYGEAGLIPDIFQNYKMMKYITPLQRHRLEMKILTVQYWRYAMYLKKGPLCFIRCLWKIVSSENTSSMTRVVFPLSAGFILIGQSVKLLLNGQLLKTLKTTVDI